MIDTKKIADRNKLAYKMLDSLNISAEERKVIEDSLADVKWGIGRFYEFGSNGAVIANMMEDFVNGMSDKDKNAFIEQITTRTHRTLQQIFFNLMKDTIMAFAEMKDWQIDGRNESTNRMAKKIKEFLDENGLNYRLPLI